MCDMTFIARSSDGLLLAETWASPSDSASNGSSANQSVKQQVKQVLRRLQGSDTQGEINSGPNKFFYILSQGVTYLTVCDGRYPRRLAFCYLEDIKVLFEDELKTTFGSRGVDYFSMLETIEAPYFFIKFDRVMQKKRQEYADSNSSRSLAKLNQSLAEVSDIMRQNIDDILQRGENLSDVGKKASDLKYASEKFKGLAKALSFRALLQQYAPIAMVVLFVLIVLFWKIYL